MSLDPALAAVRSAVRSVLAESVAPVLLACSGGADSLALVAAAVFEKRAAGVPVIGVTVDHGLQSGSAGQASRVVAQMAGLGVDETATIRVTVDPGPSGIEAGAREARYDALSRLADHFNAGQVLLGHTRDDQAETVLLGLARGSGGRSLQGMRPGFDVDGVLFERPLLGLTRAQTESACRAEGIEWWEDPQNLDPAFARSRARHTVLPTLERELGPGVAEALARTAEQLRADMDFIDGYADRIFAEYCPDGVVELARLVQEQPLALQTRVLRRACFEAGVIGPELTWEHVLAVLRAGPGKQIQLPGQVTAYREGGRVRFGPTVRG